MRLFESHQSEVLLAKMCRSLLLFQDRSPELGTYYLEFDWFVPLKGTAVVLKRFNAPVYAYPYHHTNQAAIFDLSSARTF